MPARIEWEAGDPNVPYREGWLYTLEGLKLAVRFWGRFDGTIRVVATHGWLDNLGSWDVLIPLLLRRNADFCFAALEFSGTLLTEAGAAFFRRRLLFEFPCAATVSDALTVGHGRSSHIGPLLAMSGADTNYYLQLIDLVDALGWISFSCLAHSMGGNAAFFAAAIFPRRVTSIATVEGLGPLSWPASLSLQHLRDHVRGRQMALDRDKKPQVFPTIDAAMLAARPGATEVTVRALIPRALTQVEGGHSWAHDPLVHNATAKRWTNPSIQTILEAISCPILLVAGDQVPAGWKFDERLKMLRNIRRLNVKGHHHLHIDNAEEIAGPIAAFFAQYGLPAATTAKL